jgi:hypothetical protein
MAKQTINSEQFSMMVNGVMYNNCYFRSGTAQVGVGAGSDQDYNVDTGVPKFPNNFLGGGVTPEWTTVSWSQSWRAGWIYQDGNTNLRLNVHIQSVSALTKNVSWWAIGN